MTGSSTWQRYVTKDSLFFDHTKNEWNLSWVTTFFLSLINSVIIRERPFTT